MTRYALALGSNLGDRIRHLRDAVSELEAIGPVVAISKVYETDPVGGPDQDPYLNAVVVIDADVEPVALLRRLQAIEDDHGRDRLVRWGPRTLDLDIVAADMAPIEAYPELVIPHPRARERRFVLDPLNDVWPGALVGPNLTAGRSLGEVMDQTADPLGDNWVATGSLRPGTFWVAGQLVLFAVLAVRLLSGTGLPKSFWDPGALSGGLLVLGGVLLGGAAIARLGSDLTAMPEPMPDGTLVVSAPYKWVRHPIYGGVILIAFGLSALFSDVIAGGLSLVIVGFFYLKTRYEERQLRIAYPGYRVYMSRVRNRFVPFLL